MNTPASTARRRYLAAGLLAATATGATRAQAWPTRPVRIVVGFSPGGGVDAMARLLAARLTEQLGQQVIVENRAGAAGLIAADVVSRAAPDGYTVMLTDPSMIIARAMGVTQAPDAFRAFTPVASVFRMPLMIIANNDFPATDPASLVKALQAAPGRHSFATSGVGTVHHLGFEMLKRRTNTFVVHIPYRGASQILPDVASGQLPLGVVSATAGMTQARAGRLKALAMMSPDRLPGMEGVRPLSDAVSGFDVAPSLFVLGPAGMPAPVVGALGDAIRQVLAAPATEQTASAQGAVRAFGTSQQLTQAMTRDAELFGRVIREQGIQAG